MGPGVPDAESLASLELLVARVMQWLNTGNPTDLVAGAAKSLPNDGQVPKPFRLQAIVFTPFNRLINARFSRHVEIRGVRDDFLQHRGTAWIDYAGSFRFQTDPTPGLAITSPVSAEVTLPVVDGIGASSLMKIYALYCFDTQGWLLCRVDVTPEGASGEESSFVVEMPQASKSAPAILGVDGEIKLVQRGGR